MSDITVLLAQVARSRRRMRWVLFVRAAWMTIAAAIVLTASMLYVRPSSESSVWIGGAVALGLLVAGVFTWWKGPTATETAQALDRRLGLEDRITAALAMRDQGEPIVTLIVTDARRRLEGLSPADVFRLRTGPAAWVAAAGVVLTLSLLSLDEGTARRSARGDLGTGIGAAQARGRSGAGGETATQRMTEPALPPTAAAARSAGAISPTARSSVRRDAQTDQRTGSSTNAGGSGGDRAGTGTASRGGASGAVRGGAASGGNSIDKRNVRVGAGGIAGTATSSSRAAERNRAADTRPDDPAAYRSARARAERAVAHDDVPRRLRGYVRDYFLAIRPAGSQ